MKNNVIFLSILTFVSLGSLQGFATDKKDDKSSPSLVKSIENLKQHVIWDYWYTVTLKNKDPYQYYHEVVDIVDGKMRYQSQTWKKEKGYINQETLGAYSLDDEDLTPKFFNFTALFQASELSIDGTVADQGKSKHLNVIIKYENQKKPRVEKIMKDKTIFSSMFPVWLGKKLKKLRTGQSESFFGILEDNIDPEIMFSPVPGRIWVQEPDAYSKQTKTAKVKVMFHSLESTWWVERSGAPVKIDLPVLEAVVSRVTEKEARNFLN